ncbi:MAG: hypothetical protein M3Q10_17535, partial [Chloroflexota bacterium]|nr:hypothetical protein [Chloroflexota bacterium]
RANGAKGSLTLTAVGRSQVIAWFIAFETALREHGLPVAALLLFLGSSAFRLVCRSSSPSSSSVAKALATRRNCWPASSC